MTITPPPPLEESLVTLCQLRLDRLMSASASAITGALVSTRDGFEVAAVLSKQVSVAKMAAMSSSLLSVAEAITQASGVGINRNAVLEADGGRVILLEIQGGSQTLILTAFCASQAALGQVLWPIRECAQDIGRAMTQEGL